jgi:chorismate dehydratase
MLSPELTTAKEGFEKEIRGDKAALVIGDRAFNLKKSHHYIYDLSAIWKEMTGLPFVFAAWISNTDLPVGFINSFNKELAKGLRNIDKALMQEGINDYPYCEDPKDYLNNKISYSLDSRKLEGMRLFLKKIII